MLKRILDISEKSYIHVCNKQLVIERNNIVIGTVPVEDLGVLILQNFGNTITTQAITN